MNAITRGTGSPRAIWRGIRNALSRRLRVRPLPAQEGYRLWSETYDTEDNVLATLEEEIFSAFLGGASLAGKTVFDIGCGTGRHWAELARRQPRELHGVDSSPEMLSRLRARFPDAQLHLRSEETIQQFGGGCADLVVSTLMLAHVREVDVELGAWARLLKTGGEIILTDFHPEALRAGMRTTFANRGATFEIENHIHSVKEMESIFQALNLEVISRRERTLDSTVRASYERQNRMDVYQKGFGKQLVIGFRLRKAGEVR